MPKSLKTILSIGLSIAVAAALVVVVWQSPSREHTFIEVLRILISWPVAILVIAFAAGAVFRSEISRLLERLGSLQFPGGKAEFQQQAVGPEPTSGQQTKTEPSANLITPEQKQDLDKRLEDVQRKAADEKKNLSVLYLELLARKQAEANHWFFEHLSVFLVPSTQSVLRWFTQPLLGIPLARQSYHQTWSRYISDSTQRETILSVLLQYRLLQEAPLGLLSITPLGQQFLAHMSAKLPKPPGPPPGSTHF